MGIRKVLAAKAVCALLILAGCNSSDQPEISDEVAQSEDAYVLETYAMPSEGHKGYMAGTIASSDEICSLLNHPYFLNSRDGAVRPGPTSSWDFEYILDSGEKSYAGNDWLYDYIEPLRQMHFSYVQREGLEDKKFRLRWDPTGPSRVRIERNLNDCLKKIYQQDKVRFSTIEPFLFIHEYDHNQPWVERGSPNVMPDIPCFETPYVTRERMNQNGEFETYKVVPEGRKGCLNFAPPPEFLYFDTFEYLQKGQAVNGGWWGDTFMIMLTLKEGNAVLKRLLDKAVPNNQTDDQN